MSRLPATPNRRTLYLARHGETDWNRDGRWQGRTDIPLNDRGRDQARALAERLRGFPIGAVASSHLSRARETAELAAHTLGVPFVGAFEDLAERGYGVFEGLTRQECIERHPVLWNEHYRPGSFFSPPDAEPLHEVRARMMRGMHVLIGHASIERALLVVSHGGAMRAFIDAATGTLPPPLPNAAVFEIEHDGASFVRATMLPSE